MNVPKITKGIYYVGAFVAVAFFAVLLPVGHELQGQNRVDELRSQIGDRASKIGEIEQEIKQYEGELNEVLEEKSTLQSAVRTLDITREKLGADIRITQNRIGTTNLQIEGLELEIAEQEHQIATQVELLAESIKRIDQVESNTFFETLLAQENLSDLWEEVDTLSQFQTQLQQSLASLRALKDELVTTRDEREGRRRELVNYEYELSNQETVVQINRTEKATLLEETKNQESEYTRLLEERRAAREQFERELADLESQLQIAIDPNSIPGAGRGIIAWPVENPFITQYFGETEFSRSGAYNGNGHNGLDLRAPPGSAVRSVLSGTVVETGDTDAVPGCFSYGKWALVRHNNGLSSLYAHLSYISVQAGNQVVTGQLIGNSGNTGYSTGPHLHLGLFASQGVQVVRLGDIKKITNCGLARVPVAPFAAYLDPLEYLPAL